jgi:hypothetical protein
MVEVEEAYRLTRVQVLAALSFAAHVATHLPPAVRNAREAAAGRELPSPALAAASRRRP